MRIARDISFFGSLRFAGKLHHRLPRSLAAREHHAAGQRGKHAMETERHEAAAGVEVGPVELHRGDHAYREEGHGRLPEHNDDVAIGKELRAAKIHRREERHQHAGHGHTLAVEEAGVGASSIDHVEVQVDPAHAVHVGDCSQHFQRRDEYRLQPRRPPGRESGKRPMRIIRKPSRPAGHSWWISRAQFRVRQCQQRQHAGRENPRKDRRRPGAFPQR